MTKKLCLSAALAGLALFSSPTLADNFVIGSSGTSNRAISDSSNWTVLRTSILRIGSSDSAEHSCVVNASADVTVAAGVRDAIHQYIFTITKDDMNPVTDGSFERTLDLIDNTSVRDPNSKPVATTGQFTGLTQANGLNGSGTHTFRFLGRRLSSGSPPGLVLDSSLTVMCIHTP